MSPLRIARPARGRGKSTERIKVRRPFAELARSGRFGQHLHNVIGSGSAKRLKRNSNIPHQPTGAGLNTAALSEAQERRHFRGPRQTDSDPPGEAVGAQAAQPADDSLAVEAELAHELDLEAGAAGRRNL